MARNEEKARSMLSRYLQSQKEQGRKERRPYLSNLCDNLDDAEKWRNQVIGDIRKSVAEVQNVALEEEEIRELNEKINKLLRERYHWEKRIKVLGGPDYDKRRKIEKENNRNRDVEDGVFEHKGRFYFGTARNLPEVKELIASEKEKTQQLVDENEEESNTTLYKRANIQYYGYTNNHDENSKQEEKVAEENYLKEMTKEWEAKSDKGINEPWDSSYTELIGKKPSNAPESDVQAVMLESKKAEALEQLRLGIERKGR